MGTNESCLRAGHEHGEQLQADKHDPAATGTRTLTAPTSWAFSSFDDNLFCLRKGDPVGERLAAVAQQKKILLMVCDMCAVRRGLADGTLDQCGSGAVKAKGLVDGVVAGCFPQLYAALAGSPPDYVITL